MRKIIFFVLIATLCIAGLYFVVTMSGGASETAGASRVILNEIMTSNKGVVPDEYGDFPDWIELYNPTSSTVDISGFGLSDDMLSAPKFAFPMGTKMAANSYLVLYCSGDATKGAMHAPFKLASNDELILTNASGNAIDHLKLKGVNKNASLGRDGGGNWVEMEHVSPGYPNTEEGARQYREGMQITVVDNGVRINEFMASNASTLPGPYGDYPDWIELYNATNEDVDISGCGLSDNINSPMKWVFPENTIIHANDVLLIYCSGRDGLIDGALHAPFGLRAYAEDVVFTGKNGAIIDQYSYTRQEADKSMARMPDGTGEFISTAQATPGYLNTDEGFAAFSKTSAFPLGGLSLSEAMSNNSRTLTVNNTSPDWIELHNASQEPINLAGYALSNNPKNPAKWVFPDMVIEPNAYLVVLATGNDVKDTQKKNLETNFSLSISGEVVLLYSSEGQLLDKLQLKNAGADISYGRSGASLLYFDTPTPGEKNTGGYAGISAAPLFSVTPGVYSAPFEVMIEAERGAKIYYTLDSGAPSSKSTLYTAPIRMEKNTVLRAVALQDGYLSSMSNTGAYLFTSDGADHALPIASLVFDPSDLWDKKTGIYTYGEKFDTSVFAQSSMDEWLLRANFYQGRGMQGETVQAQWERAASLSIFDDVDKKQVFSQYVSARIGGAYGRSRAQKAFNLIARAEYGDSRMRYAFFDNRPFEDYKALVLRSGAQDQNRSKIRDELATGLLEGSDVRFLYQAYKPYVLYLNGEYWGVYFLKEKRNRFFVAAHEGVEDKDNLDLIKASGEKDWQVSHGSNKDWKELMSYIRSHDLSNAEHYQYVADRMDVGSFMDYMICELYTGNSDYANIQYYRLPGGKWKWIYYDFCWGFSNVNHQTVTLRRGSVPAASDLFNAMLKNADWRDAFVRRFAQLMESVFSEARINALVDELYADVEPEIRREREKFNVAEFRGEPQRAESLGTYDGFQKQIELLRKFAKERPAVIKAQLKSELSLSDSYMKEVFG